MSTAASTTTFSRNTFNVDEIQKWITDIHDNPTLERFEEVKQKIIQEVQKLGLTNGELFPVYYCLYGIERYLKGVDLELSGGNCNNLIIKIREVFALAVGKEKIVSKLAPIDFKTLDLLRNKLEALKTNFKMIDEVRDITLKALKEKSFVKESEIKDIQRRFLLIKDKLIANRDVVVEVNCLYARIRTIFHNRGTKLPREPSEEARNLIAQLIPLVRSSNIDGLQKCIASKSTDDIDFPCKEISYVNYLDTVKGDDDTDFSRNILSLAISTGNWPTTLILLRHFAFDITEENILAANNGFLPSSTINELCSYFIPLTYWENGVSQYLNGKTRLNATTDTLMWILIEANVSPDEFVDFEPYFNPHAKDHVWKPAVYYGVEFKIPVLFETVFEIQSRIVNTHFFSIKHLVDIIVNSYEERSFIPDIKQILNSKFVPEISLLILKFIPERLADMPPRDRMMLFAYCHNAEKGPKSSSNCVIS